MLLFKEDEIFNPETEPPLGRGHEEEIPITTRGLDDYLKNLRLQVEDLREKTILDVGAGTGQFAVDLKAQGIEAEVYSLDPIYASEVIEEDKRKRGRLHGVISKDIKKVAGRVEQLPFKDKSFDLVLANFSLPWHAASKEQLTAFISESLRVLKNGGEVRFSPYGLSSKDTELERFLESKLKEYEAEERFEVIRDYSREEGTVIIRRSLHLEDDDKLKN